MTAWGVRRYLGLTYRSKGHPHKERFCVPLPFSKFLQYRHSYESLLLAVLKPNKKVMDLRGILVAWVFVMIVVVGRKYNNFTHAEKKLVRSQIFLGL